MLIDKKWGYINRAGQMVMKPQFQWAGEFSDGLAPVSFDNTDSPQSFDRKGHYGFIDVTGKLKIDAHYLTVSPFYAGIARVSEMTTEPPELPYLNIDPRLEE